MALLDAAYILAAVRSLLNEPSEKYYLDEEINKWVQEAAIDISTKTLCYEDTDGITTAANTLEYNEPSGCIKVHSCVLIPTVRTILSHVYDGAVLNVNADWDTCHNAEEGFAKDSTFGAQSILVYYPAGGYQIYRNFSYFDLSGVSGTIASAQLRLTGTDVGGVGGVNAGTAVVKGTQTSIANGGLVLGDFDSQDVAAFYGSIDSWNDTDVNTINLNAAGIAYIQSIIDIGGIALLCVLEYDHDYLDVAPAALEFFHNKMCSAEVDGTYPGDGPTLVLYPEPSPGDTKGLSRIHPRVVQHLPHNEPGKPVHYYHHHGKIGIWPLPDAAYSITVYSSKVTETITDLPSELRLFAILYCLASARLGDGRKTEARMWLSMYLNSLMACKLDRGEHKLNTVDAKSDFEIPDRTTVVVASG